MSSADSVNFQSLNMVRDELIATIEKAASDLEVFVGSQDDGKSLQACVDGIRQTVGILNLIEFPGAAMLAGELLQCAEDVTVGDSGTAFEQRLEVISNSFFALSRYLEYVQQSQRKVPVLLVQNINDLRKLRSETPILESHFFSVNLKTLPAIPAAEELAVSDADFKPLVKRLRHMYQLGLLAILQEKPAGPALMMMRRALIRLQRLGGQENPLTLLWWLGNLTFDAMIKQKMEMIPTRRLLLSRIDRVIKQVSMGGPAAMAAQAPKALVKELIYLLNLSGIQSPALTALRDACQFDEPPYDDHELARERVSLNGPSAHTVSSLARVLRTELGHTKKILENAAQADSQRIDDIDGFIQTLDKVAEILLVVGLGSPGQTLKKETERVRKWQEQGDIEDPEELQTVANTLLYIESTVASLDNAKLSDAKLAEANSIMQQEVIASGELAQAQRIVIQEAEAGLALTKRALNAYSDSDFDSGHIRNIAKTLTTVRGGMFMLKRLRAADILSRCVMFVDDVLMQPQHPPAIRELLETFADAIISVEYYLDTSGFGGYSDESVLQLAEDSLEALGYPVNQR